MSKARRQKLRKEAQRRNLMICGAVLVLMALAAGVRALQIRGYPEGERQMVSSPNGLAHVYIGRMTDKPFFGGTEEFYEIEVLRDFPESDYRASVFKDRYYLDELGGSVDLDELEHIVTWSEGGERVSIQLGDRTVVAILPI